MVRSVQDGKAVSRGILMSVKKVAAGVFIGIIAAFLAIKAPGWIQDAARQSRRERAEAIIRHLTPAKLIAACGAPRFDKPGPNEWRMEYDAFNFNFYGESLVRVELPSTDEIVSEDRALLGMGCLGNSPDAR